MLDTQIQKVNEIKVPATASERFTTKVMAEYGSGVGEIALTDFQKRLVQNYFIAIDVALKAAEIKRLKTLKYSKDDADKNPLPITWENVAMDTLARNVVAVARVGLDPAQSNHVNMIPFKNNNISKYDIVFIDGYRGIELKACKYGLDIPDSIIVELVYSTDKFKPLKKDRNNKYESYELDIVNPFDRGAVIGGFYYHVYSVNPEKNKLVIMSMKDIEKRKPKYASAEFWGGEKDVYENGKKTGKKEKVEGWFEQMCHKTIYRAAYKDITIDSQKIDDDYLKLKQIENTYIEESIESEIQENANKEVIEIVTDDKKEYQDVEIEPQAKGPGF